MFHSQIMKSVMTPAVNKIKEKGASILGSMLKKNCRPILFSKSKMWLSLWPGSVGPHSPAANA